jgi:hypothetical protein
MALVVPLGKSAFEFFDKDRQVIHTFAITIKQALDLSADKSLCPSRTMTGGMENEATLYHPGNAVVKPVTVGFDPWETHQLGGG